MVYITTAVDVSSALPSIPVLAIVLASAVYLDDRIGQMFALFILTVAAAESAIGLAILVAYYKVRNSIAVESIQMLKG